MNYRKKARVYLNVLFMQIIQGKTELREIWMCNAPDMLAYKHFAAAMKEVLFTYWHACFVCTLRI